MDEDNEVVIVTNVYGDVCLRKARRKRQKILVKQLMYDYANNTTLHGLPYMTRPGLTSIEKIFWLITFTVSVCLCLFLISKVYFKWQTSPVIVTVSEQLVPVYEVPFPSVTICPQSKCKVSVYNFTHETLILEEIYDNLTKPYNKTIRDRLAKYDTISKICKVPHSRNLSDIYPSNFTDASEVKHILEVSPNHTDVFGECYIHGHEVECSKLFDKVLTNEGLCFNMNSLAATDIFRTTKLQRDYKYLYTSKPIKDWSVEDGYTFYEIDPNNETEPEFYPAPGAENGDNPDVEVILQHKHLDRDHICNGLNSGFKIADYGLNNDFCIELYFYSLSKKVYIQHPSDLPQSSLYYYAVLNNQVSSMALSVSILSTSETLRAYDPEIRQCYFPNERYLKYFKLYTSDNCRIECMSNITSRLCECVPFYMPSSSSQKICTQLNHDCISRVKRRMLRQERSKKGGPKCHCLPACNSVDYEAEILKTDFNLKQMINTYYKAKNMTDDMIKGVNFSKLEMYFKRPRFLSMRRSELYGLIDFLSNCGGLLGLFLGFSFLSLIEIFYFLSLSMVASLSVIMTHFDVLCCTLKKDLEEEKAQHKKTKETIHDDKTIHVDKY